MQTYKRNTEPLGGEFSASPVPSPSPLTEANDLANIILNAPDAVGTISAWLEDLPELPDLLQNGADRLEDASGDLEEIVLTLRQRPEAPASLEDLTGRVNALMASTALLLAAVADLLTLARRKARRRTSAPSARPTNEAPELGGAA